MSTSVSEREAVEATTDPFPLPTGSFQLADLPQLTSDYLHSIEVKVTRVTGNLVEGQEGTFSVRVTNGAVRLTGWTLHLTSTNPDVAEIKASGSPLIIFREGGSSSDPVVQPGTTAATMYAFFQGDGFGEPDSVLEAGEVADFRFTYKAIAAGEGTFEAHVHGTVDVESLFPRGRGTAADADVEVLEDSPN